MVDGQQRKKRDTPRLIAWCCAGTVALGFTLAGVIYRPGTDLSILISSASFALDMQATDFAREQIEQAAQKAPDDPSVNFLRARLAWVDNDLAATKQFVERSLAANPEAVEVRLFRAYLAYAEADWDTALADYLVGSSAIERTGRLPIITEYRVRVGLLLLSAREFERAEAIGAQIVQENCRPAAGRLILAFSRLGLGDDTNFGQGLARAYSSDPFDALFRTGPGPLARAFPWLLAR